MMPLARKLLTLLPITLNTVAPIVATGQIRGVANQQRHVSQGDRTRRSWSELEAFHPRRPSGRACSHFSLLSDPSLSSGSLFPPDLSLFSSHTPCATLIPLDLVGLRCGLAAPLQGCSAGRGTFGTKTAIMRSVDRHTQPCGINLKNFATIKEPDTTHLASIESSCRR